MDLSNSFEISTPNGKKLKVEGQIGYGSFGYVLKVRDEAANVTAIKIVPAPVDCTTKSREALFYQACVNHPFIVQAFEVWQTSDHKKKDYVSWRKAQVKAFTEGVYDDATNEIKNTKVGTLINLSYFHLKFYPKGSLHSWLHEHAINFQNLYYERATFSRDILTGVEFLHSKKLIHRDLTPSNILIDDTSDDNLRAVISDFGTIISCGSNAELQLTKTHQEFTRGIGTAVYSAPEVKSTQYDAACDLYSIGVILLHMHFNVETVQRLYDAVFAIEHSSDLTAYQCVHNREFWLEIIQKQLSKQPALRIGCTELLQRLEKENILYSTKITQQNATDSKTKESALIFTDQPIKQQQKPRPVPVYQPNKRENIAPSAPHAIQAQKQTTTELDTLSYGWQNSRQHFERLEAEWMARTRRNMPTGFNYSASSPAESPGDEKQPQSTIDAKSYMAERT